MITLNNPSTVRPKQNLHSDSTRVMAAPVCAPRCLCRRRRRIPRQLCGAVPPRRPTPPTGIATSPDSPDNFLFILILASKA